MHTQMKNNCRIEYARNELGKAQEIGNDFYNIAAMIRERLGNVYDSVLRSEIELALVCTSEILNNLNSADWDLQKFQDDNIETEIETV